MYTLREFKNFLNEFAIYDTTIPPSANEIVFDISMPVEGLVCRVFPAIDVDTMEFTEDYAPCVILMNRRKNENVNEVIVKVNDEWQQNFERKIRAIIANWREKVTQ